MRLPLTLSWAPLLVFASIAEPSSDTDSTLEEVCTTAYAEAALEALPTFLGLTIEPSSVTLGITYSYNASDQDFYPNAVFDFCNVTFAYLHDGEDFVTQLNLWLPAPNKFQNRWLSTGGGAYAIYTGATALAGGIPYGAVSGGTDGGFGGFSTQFDDVFLIENGTINWPLTYMFGYQAHYELSLIGKAFTREFYKMDDSTKLYSYYQGCSEGGREGWSQVQRYGDEWDGAVIGAPAFRYSFQQVNHLTSNVVEHTVGYYPPPCELATIINATIHSCDPLDGKTDGVVARTDLCKAHFDLKSMIGKSYYCAAESSPGGGSGPPGKKMKRQGLTTTPAQNGTITAKGIEVAQAIVDGLRDLQGQQVYVPYEIAADYDDATTVYNSTTDEWVLDISGIGGEFVAKFLHLHNVTNLSTLDGVTYNTIRDWMVQGLHMYSGSLQTDWPDLTPFNKAGGKVIHVHGDADNSVPTASSVRYWDAVRQIMYPDLSYYDGADKLNEWYRLYLIPGAAHCAPNPEMPNGPFPQTTFENLIDWVEKGVVPTTLNATVLQGDHIGDNAQLCTWPLRPLWTDNGTKMECVQSQESIDAFTYNLTGVKLPVY